MQVKNTAKVNVKLGKVLVTGESLEWEPEGTLEVVEEHLVKGWESLFDLFKLEVIKEAAAKPAKAPPKPKPEPKVETKTDEKSDAKADAKTDEKSEAKADAKTETKTEEKTK